MKTLDEYVRKLVEDAHGEHDIRLAKERVQRYTKECEIKGYYEVIGNRHFERTGHYVHVSYHGLPNEFNRTRHFHRHDYFEMMYVYRGNCINMLPNETLYLKQGDLFLLNPNVLHCPHVESENDILLNFWISNDLIQKDIIPMMRESSLFMSFFVDFLFREPESRRSLYFSNNSERIIQHCDEMCQESFAQEAYYSSVLNSSLVTLFALLARQYQGLHPLQEPSLKDAHIYEILIYIAQNLATVTLESLAQKFQYTPAYISRLIKKHTGKSFSKTVQTQRIARAAQYLKATELPVIEIASLSGFSDLAYFNKAFKATFGLTPTEYRRQQRGPVREENA